MSASLAALILSSWVSTLLVLFRFPFKKVNNSDDLQLRVAHIAVRNAAAIQHVPKISFVCLQKRKFSMSVPICSCGESDSVEMSTVSALAEARQTSYIRGRWVYTENAGELQYRIVEPTLPGNGDYSAYNLWREWRTFRKLSSTALWRQRESVNGPNPVSSWC